jgi:hypothetical protein
MTEEEIQARVTMVSLLPEYSRIRMVQERELIATLIGVAPGEAGRLARLWWGDITHANYKVLPAVIRGIRTREPGQALQVLEVLDKARQCVALRDWLTGLTYAAEAPTIVELLRRFAALEWQPRDNAVGLLEEVFGGAQFLEPDARRQIDEALLTAVEVVPEVTRGQELAARITARLAQDALHEGD